MVRQFLFLTAISASLLRTTYALFSVHDDLLAFPQYEVAVSKSYISEEEAKILLASPPKPSSPSSADSEAGKDGQPPTESPNSSHPLDEPRETYEQLWWNDRRYLCSIPLVKPPPPMNATEKEVHRAEEEKELARATTRGWELLSDLEGKCLYFISGWWSYSFCHNREVRQFHQLPPEKGMPPYPPVEDPATGGYVLGRANLGSSGPGRQKASRGGELELQGTGESRYLVQKLGGGTICDLTKKERRIEIQYHCNPGTTDRIGFVKEVSICCYLMVVYTPRLCNDVAFLPPREGRANMIECKEVLNPDGIREWHIRKEKEDHLSQLVGEFEQALDGDVKAIDGGRPVGKKKSGNAPQTIGGIKVKQNQKQKVKVKGQLADAEEIIVVVQQVNPQHDEL